MTNTEDRSFEMGLRFLGLVFKMIVVIFMWIMVDRTDKQQVVSGALDQRLWVLEQAAPRGDKADTAPTCHGAIEENRDESI